MRKIIVIVMIVAVLSGCLFVPEEPEFPDGKFIDRLNLREIVEGTNANFRFGNYRELFVPSDNLFIDFSGVGYSSDRFISRLNSINDDKNVFCSWDDKGQSDGPIPITPPTTLNIRNFVFSSEKFGERTGDVRITIRWNDMSGWQIMEWREIGENFSIFHPDNLGN